MAGVKVGIPPGQLNSQNGKFPLIYLFYVSAAVANLMHLS